MACKVKYKGEEHSFEKFATMLHDGEVVNLISAGVLDPSKMKGEMPEMLKSQPVTEAAPKKSSLPPIKVKSKKNHVYGTKKDAMMVEDGDGNYVFYHYSDQDLSKKSIDPKFLGKNRATGRDEASRTMKASMYYTDPDIAESFTGGFKHAVLVPKDKVYPFNEDPLNLLPKAEKEFRKAHPTRSFDFNEQVGWVGKVAADKGFEMVVADWKLRSGKALRAESINPQKPILIEKVVGNTVTFKNPKYTALKQNRKIKTKSSRGSSSSAGASGVVFDMMSKKFPDLSISVNQAQYTAAASNPDAVNVYDTFDNVIAVIEFGDIYINPASMNSSTPLAAMSSLWLKIAEKVDPAIYKAFKAEIMKPENKSYIDEVQATNRFTEMEDVINQAMANMIQDASFARKNRNMIQKIRDFLRSLFGSDRDFMKMKAKDLAEIIAKDLEGNFPISTITSSQLDNLDTEAAKVSIAGGVMDFNATGIGSRYVGNSKNWLVPQRFSSVKSFLSYWFGKGFHSEIRDMNKVTENSIKKRMREMQGTAKRFSAQFKKEFKGKTQAEIDAAINHINGLLTGKVQPSTSNIISDDLQDIVLGMRKDIDYMSGEIQAYVDPTSNLYGAISNNLGVYMNRSYAAFSNGSWNKAMFPKGLSTAAGQADRSPKMQALYDAAFNFLQSQYPDLDLGSIDSMLAAMAKVDKGLDLSEFIKTGGKMGKAMDDMLKKRKDIPDVLRAFLGEYTDPMTNFYNTMANMIHFAENKKFLTGVAAIGKDKIFFDTKSSEFGEQIKGNKNQYDPLMGMYTTPEIADMLGRVDTTVKFDVLRKIAAGWKMGQTVLSPRSVVRNFYSSIVMPLANGHVYSLFAKMPKGLKYGWKELRKADDQYLLDLISDGVLGSGVDASVMKRVIDEAYGAVDITIDPEENSKNMTNRVKTVLSRLKSGSVGVYEMMDNIHRVVQYEAELADVKFMFPSKSKAEQRDMAVSRFKDTNIVYDNAPEIVKRLSASPLLGTFPTFVAEAMRISVTIPLRAVKDINEGAASKNKRQVAVGVKRLVSYGAAVVAVNTIAQLIASGFGAPDEDDDDERVIYEGSPKYSRNNTKIIVKKTPRGYSMVDLDWMNPFNFMTKAYNAYSNTGEFRPDDSKAGAAMSELLQPFFGEEAVLSVAKEIWTNKDYRGGQISTMNDDLWDLTYNTIGYALDRSKPGFIKSIQDFGAAMDVDKNYEKESYKRDVNDELVRHLLGTNVISVDVIRAFGKNVADDFAPSMKDFIQEFKDMEYDAKQDIDKLDYEVGAGKMTKEERDAEVGKVLNGIKEHAISRNQDMVAKQVAMNKYAHSLIKVATKGLPYEEQLKNVDEILSRYEYSIGQNITMNQGFKVKKAIELGNVFQGDYYIYDMGESAYNEMGFVSDETSTAKEKYINYLVANSINE